MTNLQKIKKVSKECGLTFVRTNSKMAGEYLYNFVNECGTIVSQNWTISRAINEYNFGDLYGKIS